MKETNTIEHIAPLTPIKGKGFVITCAITGKRARWLTAARNGWMADTSQPIETRPYYSPKGLKVAFDFPPKP